ncbi:MAG: type I DNA topoisomerase [Eubacteriales bacterium]|nr:type I DNA topoisomerase [Eubacteriales bacterium]MDD4389217.1 type I DNA topoisomerase [Eubacteriales bacterium]
MSNTQKNVVIVESPSKAKTIGKFLGSNYKVIASVGHVRDLPKSKLGIDIDNDFEPQYITIRGKGDIIKALRSATKGAKKIYLATDPDREGEAISWHLAHILGIDANEKCRIAFNEITKKAVRESIKNPKPIDLGLVDAQQARRILDRLVGYQISPLLWRKVRRGLSAGRVQSAALKIICDRENQIKQFIPKEYWNISAELLKKVASKKAFIAKLAEYNNKKIVIDNKEQADKVISELDNEYKVGKIEEKQRSKKPYAPFTTSSLQQEASTKLGFYTKRTMSVAQQLYEGIAIKGHGTIGLVSYIRTDSVRISEQARKEAEDFIKTNYGEEYWSNNFYKNKKKDVQDAHEAIRPSDTSMTPESIKDSLTRDQYNLYKLIWSRFIASQMAPSVFFSVSAEIHNGDYKFKATGSKLLFDGYRKVYKQSDDDEDAKMLPELKEGESLNCKELNSEQNFTQPPARFTEAGLIKDLEEKNIGRPSTYSPIIATLLDRGYISREKRAFVPTDLGFIVNNMMEVYFKDIVDAGFTAEMEDKLDSVEVDNADWKKIIRDFYGVFKDELEYADNNIEKIKIEDELTGDICELCGKPMAKKAGRFGEFLACTGYPECKNTKPIIKSVNVACPSCGKDIIQKKSKKGKIFYGCSGYPECNSVFWNKPVDKKCPECGSVLVEKNLKASKYSCSKQGCNYKE